MKHITKFVKEHDRGQQELIEDNINLSKKDRLQYYLEKMYDNGLLTKEKMNYYEDLDETDRDYEDTVTYFKGQVECIC